VPAHQTGRLRKFATIQGLGRLWVWFSQGAGQEFDDRLLDIVLGIVGTGVFRLIVLVMWVAYSYGRPASAWIILGATFFALWLLFLALMALSTRKSWREAGDYHLGWLRKQRAHVLQVDK